MYTLIRFKFGENMAFALFTIPLKPGKLDEFQAFVKEYTGPRKTEYNDLLKRYGLKTAKVWLHEIDGKTQVMVFHEIEPDALERLKGWSLSTHPFDHWFGEQCQNCYQGGIEQCELMFEFDTH